MKVVASALFLGLIFAAVAGFVYIETRPATGPTTPWFEHREPSTIVLRPKVYTAKYPILPQVHISPVKDIGYAKTEGEPFSGKHSWVGNFNQCLVHFYITAENQAQLKDVPENIDLPRQQSKQDYLLRKTFLHSEGTMIVSVRAKWYRYPNDNESGIGLINCHEKQIKQIKQKTQDIINAAALVEPEEN